MINNNKSRIENLLIKKDLFVLEKITKVNYDLLLDARSLGDPISFFEISQGINDYIAKLYQVEVDHNLNVIKVEYQGMLGSMRLEDVKKYIIRNSFGMLDISDFTKMTF